MYDKETSDLQLKFYNYQEYTIRDYEPIRENNKVASNVPLVATHFNNPYVDTNSELYRKTRIVRIPRVYTEEVSVPQFSTFMPGFEPAALVDPLVNNVKESNQQATTKNVPKFIPKGRTAENEIFGTSSVSPLSDYLTDEELKEIVDKINEMLRQAYKSFTWYNIITVIFHFLTIQIFQKMGILKDQATISLIQLDDYILELNMTILVHKNIKIIRPSTSGYLSVCFYLS